MANAEHTSRRAMLKAAAVPALAAVTPDPIYAAIVLTTRIPNAAIQGTATVRPALNPSWPFLSGG